MSYFFLQKEINMSNFKSYKYNESVVDAVLMSVTNQTDIINSLGDAAAAGLLAKLNLSYNATTRTYDCTFRYKNDSTDQSVTNNVFLVKYNSGQFGAVSADDFLANYTEIA